MKNKIKNIISLLKTAYREWNSKDPFRESAVIAYYAIFSLPGLMVVVLAIAGYFLGQEAAQAHVSSQITSTLGTEAAIQIRGMIQKASERKNSGWAAAIGVLTILIGATGVFVQFQKSLNIIWEVKAVESKSGIWSLVKSRIFSFGLIMSIAFILIVSLIISAALAALGKWVSGNFSEAWAAALQVVNFILSVSVLALLFAFMFKILPDAEIKWRHVWVGGIVTALLFELGKFGLSMYFGKANPGTGYGSAGSIILILLWVSYSSMIVFYGAEFTRAYADLQDGPVPADRHAVKQKGRLV